MLHMEAVLVVCDGSYACVVVVEAVLVVCDGSYHCVCRGGGSSISYV